jgi:hypothetical protein
MSQYVKISIAMFWILAIIALLTGWVMNLYAVITMALESSPFTTVFILRIVGVFIPVIGGVLGYF